MLLIRWKIWHLKSFYSLKHTPKQWYEKFDTVLTSSDYVIYKADKCMYSKFENNCGLMICLYVDNMLTMRTSLQWELV